MQTIFENEVEEEYSKRTGTVDLIICAGRVGRCVERKYNRENESRKDEI